MFLSMMIASFILPFELIKKIFNVSNEQHYHFKLLHSELAPGFLLHLKDLYTQIFSAYWRNRETRGETTREKYPDISTLPGWQYTEGPHCSCPTPPQAMCAKGFFKTWLCHCQWLGKCFK